MTLDTSVSPVENQGGFAVAGKVVSDYDAESFRGRMQVRFKKVVLLKDGIAAMDSSAEVFPVAQEENSRD